MELVNDTAVNVAALLREPVGATRDYSVVVEQFRLADDLLSRDLAGRVKLTKLSDEILAAIRVSGTLDLECWRCLRAYEQRIETSFTEEFRVAFDVRDGANIDIVESEGELEFDERFEINESHELDFGEAMRQEILIALPMRPVCGDDCPGPDSLVVATEPIRDERFAALAKLLKDDGVEGSRV